MNVLAFHDRPATANAAAAEGNMPLLPRTPEDNYSEKIAHLNALCGLIVNKDAIESCVSRMRVVAQDYSDDELSRFARLIILSGQEPPEHRETRLKRIQTREDALEEIALATDNSWLPAQADEDVFMDELRNEIIQAYPNPDRVGCPDESALRRVISGEINEYPDSDSLLEHTMKCGPCTRQVSLFVKEKARKK